MENSFSLARVVAPWTKSHGVFDRLEAGVSEIIEDRSDLDRVFRDAIFQDNTLRTA